MALPQRTLGRFTDGCKGFGQNSVKRFARLQTCAEHLRLILQVGIAQCLHGGFMAVDLVNNLHERTDVTVVG